MTCTRQSIDLGCRTRIRGIMGEDRNSGKASANVLKWVGTKMPKEVISYKALGVADFRASSSFTIPR